MSKPGSKSSSNTADSGVSAITHSEATRKNNPTIEMGQLMEKDLQLPKKVTYERNPDLDPQLVWRGKDLTNSSDLVVNAPPLYIQEKVHPKVLIDDLKRHSQQLESGDLEDVESHDPWRQPASHGLTGRTRRPARPGAMHLF